MTQKAKYEEVLAECLIVPTVVVLVDLVEDYMLKQALKKNDDYYD